MIANFGVSSVTCLDIDYKLLLFLFSLASGDFLKPGAYIEDLT